MPTAIAKAVCACQTGWIIYNPLHHTKKSKAPPKVIIPNFICHNCRSFRKLDNLEIHSLLSIGAKDLGSSACYWQAQTGLVTRANFLACIYIVASFVRPTVPLRRFKRWPLSCWCCCRRTVRFVGAVHCTELCVCVCVLVRYDVYIAQWYIE